MLCSAAALALGAPRPPTDAVDPQGCPVRLPMASRLPHAPSCHDSL